VSSSDQENTRLALEALLTGTCNEAVIERTESWAGWHYVWTMRYSWRRVGTAILPIDGRPVITITFQVTMKLIVGTGQYDRDWDLWYDPASHI
jgi:hypothetical protein